VGCEVFRKSKQPSGEGKVFSGLAIKLLHIIFQAVHITFQADLMFYLIKFYLF